MKYILLASLLSSAAMAAPYAQQGQRQQGQAGAQGVQGAQGQQGQAGVTGQTGAQGQAGVQNGAQGQAGQVGQAGQAAQGQAPPPAGGAASTTPQDLPTAVSNWMADTSMVSNFLNTGAAMTNDTAFKAAALVAFNAEVDELTHKAIIESQIGNDPTVQGANSTLAGGGAFQDVVDKLMLMSMMGKAAVANIDLINQNRCTNVLPNIDAYMAATGSQSRAVRPIVCDQTGIAGGVQGNGPTVLGQTPGTPQAAFTAAQQLAAGTGNGIVNGGVTQGQAGAATPAQGQAGAVPAQGQAGAATPAQGQAGAVPAQGQAGAATPAQGQAGAAQGQAAQGQAAQGQAAQGQAAQGQAAKGQAGAATPAQGQAGAAAGGAKAKGKKNNKNN